MKKYIAAKDLKEHTRIHYSDLHNSKKPTSVYNVSTAGFLVKFNAVGFTDRQHVLENQIFELVDETLDKIDHDNIPVSIPNTKTKGRSVD